MDFEDDLDSDENMVVSTLNNAAMSVHVSEKLECLYRVQEILLRKEPHLIEKYLSNVLNFTTDRNAEVKRAIIAFIEELCKVNITFLPCVISHIYLLMSTESVPVQKRVIQALITIYRRTLIWICTAAHINENMINAWAQLCTAKMEIANLIESDNDGIRTSAVKFLESIIMIQSYPDQVHADDRKLNDNFSLDDIPLTLKIARRRKLEEESNIFFELILKFQASQHISSVNLLTCLGVITNVAKNRAEFMKRVVIAIELLYNNFPPTLTTTQLNSVKKKLKFELNGLIRHPAAYEFANTITAILLDLGCSQSETVKMIPKAEDRQKYCKRSLCYDSLQIGRNSNAKRPRIENDTSIQTYYQNVRDDSEDETASDSMRVGSAQQEHHEQYIRENLTLPKTVHLILQSMSKLPVACPTYFIQSYSRLVDGGIVGNINVIASQLGAQFVETNVQLPADGCNKYDLSVPSQSSSVLMMTTDVDRSALKARKLKALKIKPLRLTEMMKPLEYNVKQSLLTNAVERVVASEAVSADPAIYQKLLITMAATFSATVRQAILSFVLKDIHSHVDLILAWLFEEYCIIQGFIKVPPLRCDTKLEKSYNTLLCTFMESAAVSIHTGSSSAVFSRIVLEAPLITEGALEKLHDLCRNEEHHHLALGLLQQLCFIKPPKQLTYLNALLTYTTFEDNTIRDTALQHVVELYRHSEFNAAIEEFCRMTLEFLKLNQPPETLSGPSQRRLKSEIWTDEFIRACLLPYISLLTKNEELIHDLCGVYVQTGANTKRMILRLLEQPIRQMDQNSVALLTLVRQCPKGGETLVTRIIHLLTDRGAPSAQLVQHVRDLYQSRVNDVRFLIPVLIGLTKQEVITALPKLIRLNPVVVREVFNRLLGLYGTSPISPSELLVALHFIDSTKADLKTVIKATSLCLQDKQTYTQQVLAVVLQQLMDHHRLPTLLMRTVIQALATYPRLLGFVMNILQRLILKQVWKQKVMWDGFIKCCHRTKPQSFAILMQLPSAQLQDALQLCPELKDPLKHYVANLTDAQRSHIPTSVQEVILELNTISTQIDSGDELPKCHNASSSYIMDSAIEATDIKMEEPLPPGIGD